MPAFLKRVRTEMRRFNIVGDTTFCKGKVARKYVKDKTALVDIEIAAENQRGEVTTPGLATVALPSRDVALPAFIDGSGVDLELALDPIVAHVLERSTRSQGGADLPLAGCRVIEHSRTVAAAYAGRLLAAMGAKVVMPEPPGRLAPAHGAAAAPGPRVIVRSLHFWRAGKQQLGV